MRILWQECALGCSLMPLLLWDTAWVPKIEEQGIAYLLYIYVASPLLWKVPSDSVRKCWIRAHWTDTSTGWKLLLLITGKLSLLLLWLRFWNNSMTPFMFVLLGSGWASLHPACFCSLVTDRHPMTSRATVMRHFIISSTQTTAWLSDTLDLKQHPAKKNKRWKNSPDPNLA